METMLLRTATTLPQLTCALQYLPPIYFRHNMCALIVAIIKCNRRNKI
jgi:hypothetical protein